MKKSIIIFTVLLTVSFSLIALFFLGGCENTKPKQLDINVWDGYVPEEVANLFEQETGINLNITLISDNPWMFSFLKGGGKADIIMPSQGFVYRYYESDLVQPVDLDGITNYEKVSKSLREQLWTKWDGEQMGSGEVYVIPYVFGTTGIIINTSKYMESLDNIGWEVFFDTELNGRVSSRNYMFSVFLITDLMKIPREKLLTDTQDTLDSIREESLALKNNVLKFYDTGAEILDLMKNEEVWIGQIEGGSGRNLMQLDTKFKYVLPETGGFGWADTFMIPKNSANPDEANLFINFMLRPDIAAMVTAQSGYNTTVEGALDMTEGIDRDLYRFTDEQLAKLKYPPNFSEEATSTIMTFWEEILTVQ